MVRLCKYRNSRIYILFACLCVFYLLFLLTRALLQHIDIALYNIPVLVVTLYSIHKMLQKRLSYELTIEFRASVGWANFIFVLTALICFFLVKNQYIFDYSYIKFWSNISYSAQYNNLFFFTYNILCSSVLACLLTFNNIENVIEFYKERKQADYPPWYINSLMYIFTCVIGFTFFGELHQISNNYFYFIGITYLSGLIWLFICRIIICFFNTIFLFLERIK